jgi:hypothetical protein
MWNRISIATSVAAFAFKNFFLLSSMSQLGSPLAAVSSILLPGSTSDRWVQFAAILGDLEHKKDVYLSRREFGTPAVDTLLTNRHQATYIRQYYPELVPDKDPSGNPPSTHTLGTIFEYKYYTDVQFKLIYLQRLPNL